MDIIPPRFTDDEVGLEAPPEESIGAEPGLGAEPEMGMEPEMGAEPGMGAHVQDVPVAGLGGAPEQSAVTIIICPNCGGENAAMQMVDDASVAQCPDCQCEFSADEGEQSLPGQEAAMPGPTVQPVPYAQPMESTGLERILGKVFEGHVRRQAHALKRSVAQRRSVSQHQPQLPHRVEGFD